VEEEVERSNRREKKTLLEEKRTVQYYPGRTIPGLLPADIPTHRDKYFA
jgi:hypothetical protein